MNKFLTNFCCFFILKKKNRHHFRKKYGKTDILSYNLLDHKDKNNSKEQGPCLNGILERLNNIENNINRYIQTNLSTFNLHQKTFPQFKNIHQGKDIVLIASGPSLDKYKPLKDTINIGVNRSFQGSPVDLDYVFIQDYSGKTPEYIKDLNKYKGNNCKKFYGLTTEYDNSINRVIPESDCIEANAYRYRTDWENISDFKTKFVYDLASQPLGCGGSVVFPAMQFALWTNPKRIYLVGCDCSLAGYFKNPNIKNTNFLNIQKIITMWSEMKNFAKIYYPETEIISINPVGLKGIFTDIYQE